MTTPLFCSPEARFISRHPPNSQKKAGDRADDLQTLKRGQVSGQTTSKRKICASFVFKVALFLEMVVRCSAHCPTLLAVQAWLLPGSAHLPRNFWRFKNNRQHFAEFTENIYSKSEALLSQFPAGACGELPCTAAVVVPRVAIGVAVVVTVGANVGRENGKKRRYGRVTWMRETRGPVVGNMVVGPKDCE